MRIKNFTLMLMAVLFSVAGFAQKSFTPRNDVAINRQTTIQKMVKQNSISAIAVNQPSTPSRSAKAPAKAPEVVTPPEKGDVEYYQLTGTGAYYNGTSFTSEDISRIITVVWDDEDEDVVYISGLSYYMPKAFVMGTFNKEGDQVTFASGQYLGNIQGNDLYFVPQDSKTNEIVDAVAEFNEKESTFTFSEYLLDTGDPKSTACYAYLAPGVLIAPTGDVPDIPVQIPQDLEIETYAYSAMDYFEKKEVSGNLNIGIYGEEVYIQGMSTDYPEAWIKGKFVDDKTVSFPSGQLLTDEEEVYFISVNDNFDVAEEYTLIYDEETGSFEEGDYAPIINTYKDKIDRSVWQFYYGYVIKPITEQPATPAQSLISNMKYAIDGDILLYSLAKVDTEGEGMVAEKLSYILYYEDAEGNEVPVTFTTEDYPSLTENLQEMPATFTDGKDIVDGNLKLNMAHDTWVRIGLQGVYYGGDERHESEIVWYTPVWPKQFSMPEGLTVTEHTFKGSRFNNGGDAEMTVGLAFDGDDIYIRGLGQTNEDIWVKGTKNADGDYVFPNGQVLGNYYDEDRLFFVGYTEELSFTDPILSVDAANSVYKFTTEIIENADYTDKSYYVRRYEVGATIEMGEVVPEVPTLVEVPEGLQTESWIFSGTDYFDSKQVARSVKVGFDGDDVYVQGLSSEVPAAWIKGTLEGDEVTFATGQFLGGADSLFFIGYNLNSGIVDYVMTYDEEAGRFYNDNPDLQLGVNAYKDKVQKSIYEFYNTTKIAKVVNRAATPATPSVTTLRYTNVGNVVEFNIPLIDTNSEGLVDSLVSYKLYYDEGDGEAKEVVFTTDLYEKIEEDMTVIPYGFTENWDFYASAVYLNMDDSTWKRIGIQTIYTGGDETNASEIGWYTPTRPFTVELPEGAETQSYAFTGTDSDGEFSRIVKIAKVDNDVYIQGVATVDSESWIKGTKSEGSDVYTFPKGQFLGVFAGQQSRFNIYLMGYNSTLGVLDVKMTYNAEADSYTTTNIIVENANYTDNRYTYNNIAAGAVIKPIPNVAAVPAQPSIDDMAYSPVGAFIDFTITAEDVEGNAVIDSLLSYKLYYKDAEGVQNEVTFTTDLYEYLAEDMTVIPYGFLDDEDEEGNPVGYDFYDGRLYLNMDISGWTAIGIQSIYAGGDEINSSDISWYEVIKPQVVSLPDGAEALDYEFQGTNYDTRAGYVIGGVKVAFVEDDIYIKGISTVNSEAWIKGTKDENGNYVFALGQFLGQTQNSRGRDVFAFLAGFDDSVGLTEFMMSYDEETGIFTTLTYMIENSNFVDAMNYLSAFLSGARLLPASHPDAIDTVEAADDEKAATFNIAGQRVGKNYKGIVVKAGRKVLQK